MQLNSLFFKGIMNKSTDERILPPGEYVDALNARLGSTEDSEIGTLENTKGNTLLTNITNQGVALSANALCIGSYADDSDETIYWFITDPGVVDLIVSFNVKTSATVYHVISTTILNFNPSNLITGVELIDRFLIFTDNLNPPRKINVDRSYAFPVGGVDQITDEEIKLIVKPPINPPTFTLSSANNDDQSFLTDKFVSFAYRFRYEDGEYSALSPFSSPAFEPENDIPVEINFNTIKNESMVNAYNAATVFFNTGSSLVKEIEVCYKESSSLVIKVIDRYSKSDLGWADNAIQSIFFRNKEVFSVLSANESLRLYDAVPLKAKALTQSGNRLMLGNYVDGYDMKDSSGLDVKLDYVTSLVNIPNEFKGKLLSSDYQVLNASSSPSTISVNKSKAVYDFGLTQFNQGAFVSFTATFTTLSSGANIYNQTAATLNLTRSSSISFTITSTVQLTDTYADVASFVGSDDFKNLIGTGLGSATSPPFKTFASAATGVTATDQFNSNLLNNSAINSVGGSSVTAINSAVPNAAAASSAIVPPSTYRTGQTGFLEAFTMTSPTQVSIQALMAVYEAGGVKSFEGFEFVDSEDNPTSFTISANRNKESLHSNRDYDVAIVYMDDYARSSTALVSLDSSINVPAQNSTLINKAQVNIPISQKPPSWAKYYKFAIKPSKLNYDTLFFVRAEPDKNDSTEFFCLLEGETAQKVADGEVYTVKRDIDGPKNSYIEATCLEKTTNPNIDTTSASSGPYAKFSPGNEYRINEPGLVNEKSLNKEKNQIMFGKGIDAVTSLATGSANPFSNSTIKEGTNVTIKILCERPDPQPSSTNNKENRNKFSQLISTRRADKEYSGGTLQANLQSMVQQQFTNNSGFFANDEINYSGNEGVKFRYKLGTAAITNDDTPTIPPQNSSSYGEHIVSFNTFESGGSSVQGIGVRSGFEFRIGYVTNGTSKVSIQVKISNIPDGLFVLETDGEDASDEIYYEGNQVFEITNDLHNGSVQNQNNWAFYDNAQNNAYRSSQGLSASTYYGGNLALTSTGGAADDAPFQVGDTVNVQQTNLSPANPQYNGTHTVLEKPDAKTIVLNVAFGTATAVEGGTVNADAIVLTNFFNCYSWGNGMESCKIQDSFKEDAVNIGERVFTLSEGEFKQKRRNASITYSGVYNDETKLNRINEFNLGILNFKDLNEDFGNIELLKARQNDLLVLQEDKVSYVLVNKNLLTTAAGQSDVTSTPTILGKQIARLEEYGISHNPESYAEFGYDKYFTDAKRGAVIKLSGSSYSNESLEVISQAGMRSYFRDLFIADFNTQKIGGYDPYMNEYVLSSNNKTLPVDTQVVACGSELEFNNQTSSFTYTVNLGGSMGTTDIDYSVTSGNINISVTYDGSTTSSGTVTGSGTFQFSKTKPTVDTAIVTVAIVGTSADYSITVDCPAANVINVYQICLNSEFTGLAPTIHNQYEWVSTSLTPAVSSPLINQPVTFTNVATGTGSGTQRVAQYQVYTSQVAVGTTPTPNAIVTVKSAKTGSDTFDFNTNNGNRLLHLLSNTTYANTQTGINNLLTAAASNNLTISSTSREGGVFQGSFTYTNTTPVSNLYLIYDYRTSTSVSLSFGSTESIVCGGSGSSGTYYLDAAVPSEATAVYNDAAMTVPAAAGYYLYVNPNPTVADTYWLRQDANGVIVQVSECTS